MPDYWCYECGGRTAMMGHGDRHNPQTAAIVERLVSEGVDKRKAVEAVGMWQIGEANLPGD